MMTQDGPLLDKPIAAEVVGIEVAPVSRKDRLRPVPYKVARVDREIIDEELLDNLGPAILV